MNPKAPALLLLVLCGCLAFAQEAQEYAPYPAPDGGYVTDLADLLTDAEEDRIESWLYTLEKRNGVEMAVVTIESIQDYPGTDNDSIESFAKGLFNRYGIGNLPDNNGVLLVVARQDRRARIEQGAGYGRRRDGDAQRIMDRKIIPQFKQNDYAGGILNGARALVAEFGGMRIVSGWVKPALLGGIAVLIPVTISLFRNGKKGWGWICVGLLIVLILALLHVVRETVESLPEGSGAGGFGGGFGGGFSGGGGASGSW